VRACLAAVAVVVLALSGCTVASQPAAVPSSGASDRLVVLDSTGRLASYDVRDLAVRWRTVLKTDHPLSFGDYPEHALAVASDGVIYAVAPAEGTRPVLFAVDAATGRLRFTLDLPDGLEARVPVPDPARGRVYLLASRAAGRAGGRQAIVVVVDLGARQVLSAVPVSPDDGRHWLPYDGMLVAGSGRLAISYHGEDTTGVEILDAATLRPVPCAAPCMQVHGRIEAYADGLAAATGNEELLLLTVDGRVTRRLNTQLARNHLMEFDVDGERQAVYAVGPCGYVGGLARTDTASGTTRLIRPPGSTVEDQVCGDRVAVAEDGSAVAVTGDGKIQVVDVGNGKILRTGSVGATVIDAAVVLGSSVHASRNVGAPTGTKPSAR
jgi:PQQ-like domain